MLAQNQMYKIILHHKISGIMVLTKITKTPCIEGYRVVTPVHMLCVLLDAGVIYTFSDHSVLGDLWFFVFKFKEVKNYEYF